MLANRWQSKWLRNTYLYYAAGICYFRIFDYGAWWATYAVCPEVFSERNRIIHVLKFGNHSRFKLLHP